MQDLCCGHLQKYNLPHLSSRLESLIKMEGLGDDQIFLGKGFKILFWIKFNMPIRDLIGDTDEQLVK